MLTSWGKAGIPLLALCTSLALGAASFVPSLWGLGAGALVAGLLFALPLHIAWLVVAASPWFARLLFPLGVPDAVNLLDMPLTLVLAARLVGARRYLGSRPTFALAIFMAAVAVSTAVNGNSTTAFMLGLLYYAQPLVLLSAVPLLHDRYGATFRRYAATTLVAIALLQVVTMLAQSTTTTNTDMIKGTLLGAGAGHHVAPSAIAVVGLAGLGLRKPRWSAGIWIIVCLYCSIVSDSKQLILAIPFALLWLAFGRTGFIRRILVLVAAGSVAIPLLATFPALSVAFDFISASEHGRGGKVVVVEHLVDRGQRDPVAALFGSGPGSTVSRAALLAADPRANEYIEPSAESAVIAAKVAAGAYVGDSSFADPVSSVLGLFGDYGIVGFLAYASIFVFAIRAVAPPDRRAAYMLLSLAAVLGLVFDWLEQAPFMSAVVIALAALPPARSASSEHDAADALAPDPLRLSQVPAKVSR